MKVGVVDIGTNSMRLLITDGETDLGRWVEVTGLGRRVDFTGRLAESAMSESLQALSGYGRLMDEADVVTRAAVATSASRDASNREEFFDRAEEVLGVRPRLISGNEEARLAYSGATTGLSLPGPVVVSDVGGGSTEFVNDDVSVSIDIGSVRLTERHLHNRPASMGELIAAQDEVTRLFAAIEVPATESLVGVAGTWTSLAAIAQQLPAYDRESVHGYRLTRTELSGLVDQLTGLTLEQTAAIPSLDPKRASVILGGAVVSAVVMEATGSDEVYISERDTLDGVAMKLLALL